MSKRDDEEVLTEMMERLAPALRVAAKAAYDTGFAAGFERGREVRCGGDAQA